MHQYYVDANGRFGPVNISELAATVCFVVTQVEGGEFVRRAGHPD